MKPTKQTVYLPIKVEDDATFLITKEISNYLQGNSSIDFYKDGKCVYTPAFITETTKESEELEHLITHRLDKHDGYFFTPEQLNQLLSDVIKDTLYQTTQSVELQYECGRKSKEGCLAVFCNNCNEQVDNNSIYSAFDKIFEKHKV